MTTRAFLLKVLFPLGVLWVVLGTLDPLEGSVLIVAGFAMLFADAFVTRSLNRTLLAWALALSAVGVAARAARA